MTNIDNYGTPAERFLGRIGDHEDRIGTIERLLSEVLQTLLIAGPTGAGQNLLVLQSTDSNTEGGQLSLKRLDGTTISIDQYLTYLRFLIGGNESHRFSAGGNTQLIGTNDEKLRIVSGPGQGYIAFFDPTNTTRWGYITQTILNLAIVSEGGKSLTLGATGGITITGDGAGGLLLQSNVLTTLYSNGGHSIANGGARFDRSVMNVWNNAGALVRNTAANGPATMSLNTPGYAPVLECNTGVGEILRILTNPQNAYAQVHGGAYTTMSSRRFKRDIATFPRRSLSAAAPSVLDRIDQVRTVTYKHSTNPMDRIPQAGEGFDRKDGSFDDRRQAALARLNRVHMLAGRDPLASKHICGTDCAGSPEEPCGSYLNATKDHIGVIAEEFYGPFPEAVTLDADGKPMGVDGLQIGAISLAGIKELRAENKMLRDRVSSLEERLSALEARLSA